MSDVLFIHVPKTGGTTIWNALGITKVRNAQRESYRPRRSPYQEVIDKESKRIIEDFCAKDFELFGYELEDF